MSFPGTEAVKKLETVGNVRTYAGTKATSNYGQDTSDSYIPAELSERLGLDRLRRTRVKILLGANIPIANAQDEKLTVANAAVLSGAQKLLLAKIQFHEELEIEIYKFMKKYAIMYYTNGLMSRKDAVKKAALTGNFLLDEISRDLAGDEDDEVIAKAPADQNGNLGALAKMEHPSGKHPKPKQESN